MKKKKMKTEKSNDFIIGYKVGKREIIEWIQDEIEQHLKHIKESRLKVTHDEMYQPTMESLQKYHVFEMTEFDKMKLDINHKLKELDGRPKKKKKK